MKFLEISLLSFLLFIVDAGNSPLAMGQSTNAPQGIPPSSNEPFQPAPKKDSWWTQRHAELVQRAKEGNVDLLFVGDSIMQGWNCRLMLGKPEMPNEGAGRDLWEKLYAPRNAANQSIGGDTIQNLLWRLTTGGEIDGLNPKVVVLLIGTNNLAAKETPDHIAAGVGQVLTELKTRLPRAKILLLGIFPRGQKPDDPFREKIRETNVLLAKYDDGNRVHFLDIGSQFLQPDGSMSEEIMATYLHPTPKGYAIWAQAMQPTLDQLWN